MFALLLLLAVPPEADRLGAPDWSTREWEEFRFRIWGRAAWPTLLSNAQSENAEVRDRVQRLLAPHQAHVHRERASAILTNPWPMSEGELTAFFLDERLRFRVKALAEEMGCSRWDVYHLDPDKTACNFFGVLTLNQLLYQSVADCRKRLNVSPGWPFTKGDNGTSDPESGP